LVSSEFDQGTIGETLESLMVRLEKKSDLPGLDVQVLMAHLLDRPRSWVVAHAEMPLQGDQFDALMGLVGRLETGEPLPYILGHWEFYHLEFEVNPDVLIPRPETELLVERAIAWLSKLHPGGMELKGIDVGTGCGCIAISIAFNIPGFHILATDISSGALNVARRNARKLIPTNPITFLEADLFAGLAISDRFSLIAANPPYIPTPTLHQIPVYGREPTLALDGGPDGMKVIRRLLQEAPKRLLPGGLLLMEIEASQGSAVLSMASHVFPKAQIRLHKDLAGHDRLLEVQA
jgi:release factor glutamine methyltransferase